MPEERQNGGLQAMNRHTNSQIIQGQAASAKIFADEIEEAALEQVRRFLDCDAFSGATIRIMPDVHAGVGAVIGFTATLTDKIIPNVIGVDIGCGVCAWKLGPIEQVEKRLPALDSYIREHIPSGTSTHRSPPLAAAPVFERMYNSGPWKNYEHFQKHVEDICSITDQKPQYVFCSQGTLGGGNHFIELDEDDDHNLWLTIHSGSRQFGLLIARWHQQQALKNCGPQHGLEHLEGVEADRYCEHMEVAQTFARLNRQLMGNSLVRNVFKRDPEELLFVESVHNYIDFADRVIRKGAISARQGEPVIIPWNMRDGLMIGRGLGNSDWNQSAPHGAGRKLGRRAAKAKLTLEEFRTSMHGIWSSCISQETLDESPMAYKSSGSILSQLAETVTVEFSLKPRYNFKASE